jgi:hypothetical protein
MHDYYYETTHGLKGWKKAETDREAVKRFSHYGPVKVWRVARGGTKTLILNQKR